MESIGQRVRRLRDMRGFTQAQLLDAIGGNSLTIISRIENDVTREMRLPMARKLAVALNVTPEYILYGDNRNTMYSDEVYNYIMDPNNKIEIELFVREKMIERLKAEQARQRKQIENLRHTITADLSQSCSQLYQALEFQESVTKVL